MDIAAFKVSHSVGSDMDATALPAARARSVSIGMKVQGEFKMQAHIRSGVVMNIASFKVSHSVGCDIDATALRVARARSSSIGIYEKGGEGVQHRGDG